MLSENLMGGEKYAYGDVQSSKVYGKDCPVVCNDTFFFLFVEHYVDAGCGWSCPTARNATATGVLPPHGAGVVFETETTIGVVALHPGEGDLHITC